MVMPAAASIDTHPYTPSGSMAPSVWDPGSSKWVNGNVQADYAEGQFTASVVTLVPAAGRYTIDLCLQVYDGPKVDQFAFVDFGRWDETVTGIPTWPASTTKIDYNLIDYDIYGYPDGTAVTGSSSTVGGFNLILNSVSEPLYRGYGCTDVKDEGKYFGVRVEYTKLAGTSYVVYGGQLSYPGAPNPDTTPGAVPTVPFGKSASTIGGTFQSRIVGTGDKTINFSAGVIIEDADIAVTKACPFWSGTVGYYVTTVINNGPAVAYGMGFVDELPANIVPYDVTSVLTTNGVDVPYTNCSWADDGDGTYTVTCDPLAAPLFPRSADPTATWVVVIPFTGSPQPNENVITVNSLTYDPSLANNTNASDPFKAVCLQSSAVDLISFTAVGGESSVALAWETAQEIDNVGFNLYRTDSVSDGRIKLNGEIIPAANMGSVMGATYAFTDSAVSKGVTYFYWLEDVETTGALTMHGPVSARLVEAAAAPAPAPVFVRPVRELPVIGLPAVQQPVLQQPLPQPVVLEPVLQMPLIVTPGPTGPVFTPAPVMPAPIVRPPMTGLPVEGSVQ